MPYRFARRALAASLALLPLLAHATLADSLKNLGAGVATLGGGLATTAGTLSGGLGTTLGTLGGGLTTTLGTLGGGLGTLGGGLDITWQHLSHQYLDLTPGTTSTESYIEWQGVARKVIIIAPQAPAPGPAPAVVVLHYSGGTPEVMANLTQAGRLAAEHGAWVLVPEAANGEWQEDPDGASATDDVGFLAKLISTATASAPIDPKRIYMMGMSNGGFMAERFGCERAGLLAGAAIVAAVLRKTQSSACAPAHALPMAIMLGSKDPRYAPYFALDLGLLSGEQTFARYASLNGCAAAVVRSQLPDLASDGTTTTLEEAGGCAGGGTVQYYDIEGGGHTWPQGAYVIPPMLGRVAQDFNATDAIWDFFAAQPPAP